MQDSTRRSTEVSTAVTHFTPARMQTSLRQQANQQAWRPQYSRPSCACLNQAIRMALQQPGRLGCLWEKNPSLRLSRRVLSTPELHMWWTKRPILPSLLPYLLFVDGLLAPTQRNAAQRNATQPHQPSPAQPNPSYPNPKLARLVPRPEAPAAWSSVLLESRQVGASLKIQRSSSRQTQDRSRPGRQTTSSQYTVPARQTTSAPATHPRAASSEPACLLACPHPPRSTTIHTRTRSISSSCAILPCPALILHRISARYTPRRAAPPACLPQ